MNPANLTQAFQNANLMTVNKGKAALKWGKLLPKSVEIGRFVIKSEDAAVKPFTHTKMFMPMLSTLR